MAALRPRDRLGRLPTALCACFTRLLRRRLAMALDGDRRPVRSATSVARICPAGRSRGFSIAVFAVKFAPQFFGRPVRFIRAPGMTAEIFVRRFFARRVFRRAALISCRRGGAGAAIGAEKSGPESAPSFSPSCSRKTRVGLPRPRQPRSSPSWNGPNETRMSRVTVSPRWPRTLRTSRCLPSRMAKVSQRFEPCTRSIVGLDGAIADAADRDAVAQSVELRLRHRTMGAHAVAPQPAGRRQFQHPRQRAVIGEEQEALGIEVEPADADQARQLFRQILKYRRPAFRVGMRGQQPARLVIKEKPRALGPGQRLAVDADAVGRRDIERRRVDHRAVDGDAAGGDPTLRLAARGEPGAGDYLGDTLAGFVLMVVSFALYIDLVPGIRAFIHRNG